jgi:hypothetical protein
VVNVGFIRRDMSHTQAIALARERGFRPALLPETIPVIHGGNHQHLEEIFRAMMIAAQSRRKPWATNCLALACAAKDKFTPVQQIVHGEGRFEARVAFREIDPSALVPHLLGMTFVRV